MATKKKLLPALIFLSANAFALPASADIISDCTQKGDPELGIRGCTAVIRQDPRNAAGAYNNRGIFYADKHVYEQAIADYTRAIELNPKQANAFFNRGNAYFDKGDYDEAITDYTRAILLDPNNGPAFFKRGIAHYAKGDYAQAIADYTGAIAIEPRRDCRRQFCLSHAAMAVSGIMA